MTTSARESSARLADLLRREHDALAEFLVALADFDRERGWVELGYASLFDYLHRQLALSKGSAFYRMTAARLLQAHPEVIAPLRDGRLCLTTVVELAKALDAGVGAEVVSRFFHASKREAKAVVAELLPADAVPLRTVVTSVRAPPPTLDAARPAEPAHRAGHDADLGQTVHLANHSVDPGQSVHPANHGTTGPSARPSAPVLVEEPLTAELSRIHVTVPRHLMKKLEAARAALSHSRPGASEADVLELGLDLIVARHAKRRGLVRKPRSPKEEPGAAPHVGSEPVRLATPRVPEPAKAQSASAMLDRTAPAKRKRPPGRRREAIPAHVKRAVWLRDGGRCTWPVDGGGVCGSTTRVQLDHVVPVALGGVSTIANVRCLCAAHNDRAARELFGDAHMDAFTRGARATGASPPSR